MRTFLFAGGGTGGHLFPGIAVAHALREIEPDAEILFLTTSRPLDAELLDPTPFERIPQTVRPLPSPAKPWRWPGFLLHWRKSVAQAAAIIRERRPAGVLGLGGYAAGPAVVAGRRLGVRTAILNPDAIPGHANRRLARYADVVVLQWDVSRRHFPPDVRCETLGCPIRETFAAVLPSGHGGPLHSTLPSGHGGPLHSTLPSGHGGPLHSKGKAPSGAGLRARESESGSGAGITASESTSDVADVDPIVRSARAHFGLRVDRPVLLVTGASQGARTVNQAMQAVWPALAREHPDWQLLHLTGSADEAPARSAYESAGAAATVLAFTHDMHLALAAADVVVSRAGASTLAELTALGKPSILLPYPYHRDRHQHANGQVLVDAGAAIMLEDLRDPAANRGPLSVALRRLLGDAVARNEMRVKAAAIGKPGAARAVAQLLMRRDGQAS